MREIKEYIMEESVMSGGMKMGVYYLLLLAVGVGVLAVGIMKRKAVRSLIGVLFVVAAILLLQPGSSDVLSQLLIKLFY